MSLCTVTRIRVVRVLLGVLEKAALGFGVVLARLGRLRRERHSGERQRQRHDEHWHKALRQLAELKARLVIMCASVMKVRIPQIHL